MVSGFLRFKNNDGAGTRGSNLSEISDGSVVNPSQVVCICLKWMNTCNTSDLFFFLRSSNFVDPDGC